MTVRKVSPDDSIAGLMLQNIDCKQTNQERNQKSLKISNIMQQSTTSTVPSDFECFQNYTAPEIFVQQLAGVVNQGDISCIIKSQKQM